MAKPHTETSVEELPFCNYQGIQGGCSNTKNLANFDGKTHSGPWAYMCGFHFDLYGVGLGLGLGQKLIVKGGS